MQTKRKLFLCGSLDISIGIRGNEAADRAVKEALNTKPTSGLVPFSDLTPLTSKYVSEVWQEEWDASWFGIK